MTLYYTFCRKLCVKWNLFYRVNKQKRRKKKKTAESDEYSIKIFVQCPIFFLYFELMQFKNAFTKFGVCN